LSSKEKRQHKQTTSCIPTDIPTDRQTDNNKKSLHVYYDTNNH
jgi:hypothetical protein